MAKTIRSGGATTAKERAKNRRIRAAASAVVKGATGGGLGKIVSKSAKGALGGLKRKSGVAVTRAEIRKHLKSVAPGSDEARNLINLLLSPTSGGAVTPGEFSKYDKAAKKRGAKKILKKAKKTKSGRALTAAVPLAVRRRSGAAVTKTEKKRYKKR